MERRHVLHLLMLLTTCASNVSSRGMDTAFETFAQRNKCIVYLTEPEGEINWTGDRNSPYDCSWIISLNTSFGVALRVDEVLLDTDVTLKEDTPHDVSLKEAQTYVTLKEDTQNDFTMKVDTQKEVTKKEKTLDVVALNDITLNTTQNNVTWDDVTEDDSKSNDMELTLYSGGLPNPQMVEKTFKGDVASVSSRADTLFAPSVTLPASVILVHHHQVLLHLTSHSIYTGCFVGGCAHGESHTRTASHRAGEQGYRAPSFKVTYVAVTLETMPPKVGQGRYNCSTPYVVPSLLRCDVAWQCVGGEDERGSYCDYNSLCGRGGLFLGDCLRYRFPGELISPAAVTGKCNHTSTLLNVLQDPVHFPFITRVVSLSGYDALIIDISKVRTKKEGLAHLYRFLWQWKGGVPRVIYSTRVARGEESTLQCAVLRVSPYPHLQQEAGITFARALRTTKGFKTLLSNPQAVSCSQKGMYGYVCSLGLALPAELQQLSVSLPKPQRLPSKFPTKECSDGSFTHPFLPCSSQPANTSSTVSHLPMFECSNGVRVDYSLECDGIDDCGDVSDEQECGDIYADTEIYLLRGLSFFRCARNWQLIVLFHLYRQCDGTPDCFDNSDEEDCLLCRDGTFYCDGLGCLPDRYLAMGVCPSVGVPPKNTSTQHTHGEDKANNSFTHWEPGSEQTGRVVQLDLDGYGLAVYGSLDPGAACPETHVPCSPVFCIPVYLVNNGQLDCPYPYNEESDDGQQTPCPGYYRCYRHPEICLHDDHLCDGNYQCPLKDDERYCYLTSPPGCTRQGHALRCNKPFPIASWLNSTWVRYLDMSGVFLTTSWVNGYDGKSLYIRPSEFVNFVNLSSCGLDNILSMYGRRIVVLDLSFNNLRSLEKGNIFLHRLTHLNLSHNPLFLPAQRGSWHFLQKPGMNRLLSLTVTTTDIQYIEAETFSLLKQLTYLDIRNNSVREFHEEIFSGLAALQKMFTDDPRLCCIYFSLYPDSKMDCIAPVDELSSCEDLLRSDFFRGFLWTLSVMAVIGNTGVLVYRLFLERTGTSAGFRVLVSNLCASDLLMGVYLVMIGAADAIYRGRYLWKQESWTQSGACKVAGFLSLLSSEVSAFIICIITLDRLLVLYFPLKRHLHLGARATIMASCVSWAMGVTIASVPLLASWEFYSQSGICLPLPITRGVFSGQHYVFGVYIVFNLILFLLIGAGQLLIYLTVRKTSMAARTQRSQQDAAIARRLFLIVFSDFCCWFPIGLIGVLASRGTPIPGVVKVWVAIFVLPLNSAFNPFLYTLNTLLERRRKERLMARLQLILARLDREMVAWSQEQLDQLQRHVQRVLIRHTKTDDVQTHADRDNSGCSLDTESTRECDTEYTKTG